jgi:hypothetical protein
MIDREMWESKAMRKMPSWAQLLHINMYLDLADFAGIVDLDPRYTAFKLNLEKEMPMDFQEIATALAPLWKRVRGTEYFIMPNFIQQTQGTGFITFSSNAHVYILKAMEQRWLDGLKDVQQIVSEANPSVVVEPIEVTISKLNEKCESAESQDQVNGYKGNSKAINNALRIFHVIGNPQAMGFKEGSKEDEQTLTLASTPKAKPQPQQIEEQSDTSWKKRPLANRH